MKILIKQIISAFFCFIYLSITGNSINAQPDKGYTPWYKVKQLAEKTWCISDNGMVNIYLIEGKERAILIDNGYGFANLRDVVKSMTKLPLTLIITHGHRDHCGAVYQFPLAYAHPLDIDTIEVLNTKARREKNIKDILKDTKVPDSEVFKDTIGLKPAKIEPVKDGYIFDLGGKKLEVIEVPGHTPGSIVLLDASDKMLFAGDNDNSLVWLFLKSCLPLETYLKSLEKLQMREKEFTVIYPGHGDPLDTEFLNEQVICCKSILDGSCKGEIYHSFAGDALKCEFKRAGIAFNPNNLFLKK